MIILIVGGTNTGKDLIDTQTVGKMEIPLFVNRPFGW